MLWSSPLPLLLLLLGVVCSKNVLVITSAAGSHQYFSADVATLIAERGHNVTLLSMMPDPRVSFEGRPFSNVYMRGSDYLAELSQIMNEWMVEIADVPTEVGMNSMITISSDEVFRKLFSIHIDILQPYFTGGPFQELLDSTPFDLIVLEDSAFENSKLSLAKAGIPVIGVTAVSDYQTHRVRENYPTLLNSEINQYNTIIDDTPPSLSDRLYFLKQLFRVVYFLVVRFPSELDEEESDVTMEESNQILSAVFVYDHPALSFPILTPPYMFNLGFFYLDKVQTKPVPEQITRFTEGCSHVIYMSFGSYTEDITVFPIVVPMLRGLAAVQPGVCLILKTKQDLSEIAPELKILQLSWVPQKDLLASGKVSMFVSHCGNNGRMESLFYGVPILCVPLFGDQYYDARLVERRQFGRFIAKETITGEAFRADVEDFLGKVEGYRTNIAAAREFVKADPSSGREMFLFICEHVLKGGDLSFLKNRILQKQGMVEVYNLDIFGLAMAVVALVTGLVLWVFWKCLRCTCRRVMKLKTE